MFFHQAFSICSYALRFSVAPFLYLDFVINVCRLFRAKFLCPSFVFSWVLQQRIKALETAQGATVQSLIQKISYYGGRRVEDFDKYEALRYAEELASVAKSSSDPKAASFDLEREGTRAGRAV